MLIAIPSNDGTTVEEHFGHCRQFVLVKTEDGKEVSRDSLVPPEAPRVVIEAGVAQGWEALSARVCPILSIDRFGLSAPGPVAANALGISAGSLGETVLSAARRSAGKNDGSYG